MYLRELEEGSLERATVMDRVASRALQVGAWACADAHGNACRELGCPWDQASWYPRELTPFPSYPIQSLAKPEEGPLPGVFFSGTCPHPGSEGQGWLSKISQMAPDALPGD